MLFPAPASYVMTLPRFRQTETLRNNPCSFNRVDRIGSYPNRERLSMELPGSEFYLWFMCSVLALGVLALAYRFYKKRTKPKAGKGTASLTSVEVVNQTGPAWVLEEIARFRKGGEMSESFIRKLSQEERAFIEVALIDALTKWPREDQHRLRSMLI